MQKGEWRFMENNKSRRCSCGTPRLRNRRSHACSTCRKQVNRSRREELNFLNLLNGGAEKTGVVGEAVGKREEEKELVAVDLS